MGNQLDDNVRYMTGNIAKRDLWGTEKDKVMVEVILSNIVKLTYETAHMELADLDWKYNL